MNRIITRIVEGLIHFLILYFSLCLLSMIITWTGYTPIAILKRGVWIIGFVYDFGHTIFYLLIRLVSHVYQTILLHFHIKRNMDLWMYWIVLIMRIIISISGVYFFGKTVIDTASNAAQNHPAIFWILFIVIFCSIGVTSSPIVGGTFHISRNHAISTPWVEYRLIYVLLDAFLKFVLGIYLISLLCLSPHRNHEK